MKQLSSREEFSEEKVYEYLAELFNKISAVETKPLRFEILNKKKTTRNTVIKLQAPSGGSL